jgi:hypothetical protein
MSARFYDPTGARFGLPTYPRDLVPSHLDLRTRTQLRALGLRPGGQDPVAQIAWASRCGGSKDGVRVAYLYHAHLARPVRPMTAARERALAKALLARHTCRTCEQVHEYCLPTSRGRTCPPGTGCSITPAALAA